mmetsp:Transcript_71593/g.190980  ORF Transcript_71593/g.190980 Transcript_71593/m.190980 type:complete len:233 (+) Transcript_71593:836-1534(+)
MPVHALELDLDLGRMVTESVLQLGEISTADKCGLDWIDIFPKQLYGRRKRGGVELLGELLLQVRHRIHQLLLPGLFGCQTDSLHLQVLHLPVDFHERVLGHLLPLRHPREHLPQLHVDGAREISEPLKVPLVSVPLGGVPPPPVPGPGAALEQHQLQLVVASSRRATMIPVVTPCAEGKLQDLRVLLPVHGLPSGAENADHPGHLPLPDRKQAVLRVLLKRLKPLRQLQDLP